MTLRAKISEPYSHVIFAFDKHNNLRVTVKKLDCWSLNK